MGSDNEFSGFRVSHKFSGVHANAVLNALVTRNTFIAGTVGFEADNCAGTIIVRDSTFQAPPLSSSFGVSLSAEGSSSYSAIVQNNTFINSNSGVVILGTQNGVLDFDIHRNTFLSNSTPILLLQTGLADAFDAVGKIRNNTMLSSLVKGIQIFMEGGARGDFVINDNLIQGRSTNLAPIELDNSSTSTMNVSASRNQLLEIGGEFVVANGGTGITNLKLVENRVTRVTNDPGYLPEQTAGTFNLQQLDENLGVFSQTGTITITD